MKRALNEVDPPAKLLWPDLNAPDHIQKFAEKWGAAEFIDGEAPHPYNMHYKYPEEQEYHRGIQPTCDAGKEQATAQYLGHRGRLFQLPEPRVRVGPRRDVPPRHRNRAGGVSGADPCAEPLLGIAKTFWYDLYEDGADAGNLEYHFGLLRDGTATPKPAAIAYANLVHQLRNTKYAGKLGRFAAGSYGFAFASSGQHVGAGAGGQYVLVLWTKSENARKRWP